MVWEKQQGSGGGFWTPTEEGDELVGIVKSIEEGEFGTNYLIQKDDADKTEIRTRAHAVLIDRMKDTKIGDHVKIVYLGLTKSPKGWNPTTLYEVFIEKLEQKEAKK